MRKLVFLALGALFLILVGVTPRVDAQDTSCHLSPLAAGGDLYWGDLMFCGDDIAANSVSFVVHFVGGEEKPLNFPGNHGGIHLTGLKDFCMFGKAKGLPDGNVKRCFTVNGIVATEVGSEVPQPTATAVAPSATNTPDPGQGGGGEAQATPDHSEKACPQGTTYVPVRFGAVMIIKTESGELNIRAKAGKYAENPSIKLMTTAMVITSTGDSKCAFGDIWMRVQAEGVEGWAAYQGPNNFFFMKSADKTANATPAPTATATPTLPIVGLDLVQLNKGVAFVMVKETVTVMSSSGPEAKAIGIAPAGKLFTIVGVDGTLTKVQWSSGNTGWVPGAVLLSMVNDGRPLPTVAPTATPSVTLAPTLEPSPTVESMAPVNMQCGPAPKPLLVPGQIGHNSPDYGITHVRLAARSDNVVYELKPSEEFLVLTDVAPDCRESGTDKYLVWYHIRITKSDGSTIDGFAPEGSGKTQERWLLPGKAPLAG